MMKWDIKTAEAQYERARGASKLYFFLPYFILLQIMDQTDKALELAQRRVENDPLSPIANYILGLSLIGRIRERIQQAAGTGDPNWVIQYSPAIQRPSLTLRTQGTTRPECAWKQTI